MRRAALFLVCLAGCSGGPGTPANTAEFVAGDGDFAGFQAWTMFQLPDHDDLSDLVYPAGTRKAFLNHPPPAGATLYSVGTVIVKTIEVGAGPADWEIFAMTKRGGSFNPAGAKRWEFFLLRIGGDGEAHVISRGIDPSDDGRGDMGLPTASGGYFDGQGITPCNVCHGQAKLAGVDYMLGAQLLPSAVQSSTR
jgi:hypothetical protein